VNEDGDAVGVLPGNSGGFDVGDSILITSPPERAGESYEILTVDPDNNTEQHVFAIQGAAIPLGRSAAIGWSLVRKTNARTPSRRVTEFEVCWTPPLSILNIDHGLPVGEYELILQPQSSSIYQQVVIESTTPKEAGTDFNFSVKSLLFFANMVQGPRTENSTFVLDLHQARCQTVEITSNSFNQKSFDVAPSTSALTVCFQDGRVYLDTLLQSDAFFECGGSESLTDWQERGAYYHFRWPRDGSDSSTKVRVYSQFSGGMTTNGRMLLFDHSHFVATIQIKDGRCVNVNVQDV